MRRTRPGAVILCYHNIVSSPSRIGDPGLHLSLDAFARQVDWLRKRFDLISLSRLLDALHRGASVRGQLVLTFDDAYTGTVRNALPWLDSRDVPSTTFVTVDGATSGRHFWWDHPAIAAESDEVGLREQRLGALRGDREGILSAAGVSEAELESEYLPARWDTLRAARGPLVEYGGHSVSHRSLTALTDSELAAEVLESRVALERELGAAPAAFAYPYGRWDARVAAAVRHAGFRAGLTLEGGDAVPSLPAASLPRINIPTSLRQSTFEAWVSGLMNLRSRQ